MRRHYRLRVLRAVAVGLLLLSVTVSYLAALAQSVHITDEAHLFSPDAVRRAEEQLRLVFERTGKTVRIVTVETLPPGTTVDGEAQRRFRTERINGLLVLIARRERAIAVRVGRYTAQVFGPAERRAVLDLLRRRFRVGEYDVGLLEAVAYIGRVLTSAAPSRSAPAPASGPRWGWLVPVLLAAGGALVLGLLVRRLSESQAPPTQEAPPAPPPAASPWGGFLGGVLGGLFGSWLGQTVWGPREVERPTPPPPSPPWQADDTLVPEGDVGESVTWDDAGTPDLPEPGDVDSTQW